MQPDSRPPVDNYMSAQTAPATTSLARKPAILSRSSSSITFHVSRFTLRVSVAFLSVAALTVASFFLRRYHLGAESFWFDEADIVSRAQGSLSSLVGGFTRAG